MSRYAILVLRVREPKLPRKFTTPWVWFFQKIVEINQSLGITILLVEQNANLALEISHYGYVRDRTHHFARSLQRVARKRAR